ncbi:MAG: ABC transporter permease [Myxococcota bacterium]
MSRLGRVRAMALKEVMHIVRDRQVIIFALGMPLVLLLLFGYAVSFDAEHIPLAVVDQGGSAASRDFAEAFTASTAFDRVITTRDPEVIEPLFRRGLARAALVLPRDYARRLSRGEEADAQLVLDGSDNNTAAVALGYGTTLALEETRDAVAAEMGAREPPLEVAVRTLFNPRMESAIFLVPGLMVVILVMIAVMLTALTVAREYEHGSMEQLFATPVGRLEIILGKLGPYYVLGLVQVLLVLTVGVALFDVPIRGSLPLLFGVASLFLLGMLAQGLVVSVVARSQMLASQVAALSTVLPALLLSGFIFPVDNMPPVLQALAHAMPPMYFVRALRAILLRGNGLDVVWLDCLAMGLFFLAMLALATRRFRRTLA